MTVRLVKADLLHGDINLFVDEVWLNDVHHAVVGERQSGSFWHLELIHRQRFRVG